MLNSRYLLYEAQQAHFYGLADNVAISTVTSTPGEIMGMGHRIGFVKKGKHWPSKEIEQFDQVSIFY